MQRSALIRLVNPSSTARRCVFLASPRYRPFPKTQSTRCQMTIDILEQTLTQVVHVQKMSEVQDRRLVWQRSRQPHAHEPSDRLDLVEHVLHGGVAQIVEQLHAVNAQHHRQIIGTTPSARLRIERSDAVPRKQTIHAFEESLPTGLSLLVVVFEVRKCSLVHRLSLQLSQGLQAHVTMPQSQELNQSILSFWRLVNRRLGRNLRHEADRD